MANTASLRRRATTSVIVGPSLVSQWPPELWSSFGFVQPIGCSLLIGILQQFFGVHHLWISDVTTTWHSATSTGLDISTKTQLVKDFCQLSCWLMQFVMLLEYVHTTLWGWVVFFGMFEHVCYMHVRICDCVSMGLFIDLDGHRPKASRMQIWKWKSRIRANEGRFVSNTIPQFCNSQTGLANTWFITRGYP